MQQVYFHHRQQSIKPIRKVYSPFHQAPEKPAKGAESHRKLNFVFNWGQETAMRARNPKERRPHTHSQNHKTSCHHAMKGSTDRLRILKISEYKKEISIVPLGTLKSINTHYRCSKPRSPPVNSTLLSQPPRSMSHHTRRHLVCLLFLTAWKNHSKTILQLPCSTSARSDIYPVTTTTLLHSIFIFFLTPLQQDTAKQQ